jgi:peptide deformylase
MILPIVKFGHPALRQKGVRVERITSTVEKLIADMFETMYEAAGIGLAAQQIGQALQITVIDVRSVKERPSTLELAGKAADVASFMPLVLINPQIRPFGDPATGPEGCLSFPEIYADITRLESVEVEALNAGGETIRFKAGGLLARAIQHEVDHLNGILFIDRMSVEEKAGLKSELDELQKATKAALGKR